MKRKEESKAALRELIQNSACGIREAVLVVLPTETGLGWAAACPVFDISTCTGFRDLFPHSMLLWLRGWLGIVLGEAGACWNVLLTQVLFGFFLSLGYFIKGKMTWFDRN